MHDTQGQTATRHEPISQMDCRSRYWADSGTRPIRGEKPCRCEAGQGWRVERWQSQGSQTDRSRAQGHRQERRYCKVGAEAKRFRYCGVVLIAAQASRPVCVRFHVPAVPATLLRLFFMSLRTAETLELKFCPLELMPPSVRWNLSASILPLAASALI